MARPPRVLLAFTLAYERDSPLSLAISANVLRVLTGTGVRVRDLPALTGVSKEAVSATLTFLDRRHHAVVEPPPDGSRFKIVRLTPQGHKAQTDHRTRIRSIDKEFTGLDALRSSLNALPEESLFESIARHPDGWRAQRPKPSTFPHHPMVLHRGAYPDGS